MDEKDQGLFQNGRNTRNVEENVALNNMIAIFKKVGVTHYVYSIYHFQIVIKIRLPERQKQKKSIKQKCMVSILPPGPDNFILGEGALIITYPIRKAGNQNVTRISKMQRFNISVFSVSWQQSRSAGTGKLYSTSPGLAGD
ncbi:hypothetical protein [Yersinia pestis]|uniref:hypothetical protein n=1 Tax=Enterobacterales TaxID=91347 RepID=UPI001EF05710|nr:hypothetical protein [Yersinia pestis]